MIRYGTVVEEKDAWASVLLETAGGNTLTPMFPVVQRSTMDDKDYRPLAKGALVSVVIDDNGEGVILGAVYNNKDRVPEGADKNTWVTEFKDGTVIKYDNSSSKLVIESQGDVDIEVSGSCSIEAQSCNIKASGGAINGLRCQYTGRPNHTFG
ncbi:phage baseplate assembly protein V [Prosthecochloris sp. SCSIO W1102]|uniref:phage baseplate assembly protein V n=1 Tax=Prosthecochloris sp. SCSIO W1102 TaxID=2992243 RepID=UPI00223E0810|nr:phage baseplate assembly protein V [Prosthecochloris sp. SCSIO W1102]UZJ39153.1 phage baseplate assembly protein V [Prosthecochloris sp. SCSIO W1102]